jgi:hypothetical protein
MENQRDVLSELQAWFLAHCNEDWEHSHGVSIGTLDNPGWSIEINLDQTELETRPLTRYETHRTDQDWVVCWREDTTFRCACGPLNLTEAVTLFLEWATRPT